jgi:hypothetical protein
MIAGTDRNEARGEEGCRTHTLAVPRMLRAHAIRPASGRTAARAAPQLERAALHAPREECTHSMQFVDVSAQQAAAVPYCCCWPASRPVAAAAAARLQLALWCFQCALAQAASQYLQAVARAGRSLA